ncbi:hypothetical protein [Burkholderia sp. AU45388]|uniref:hypothetical protein n=1 Tax=Burkholderia sp. AU45388 TaxID=3059206 RepID=UPI00264FE6F7|nr:hypothetical protein [Burkholderia sp. AU45388]MDN7430808.1 hypothetical protein [Burkholderia sp. AU45388]
MTLLRSTALRRFSARTLVTETARERFAPTDIGDYLAASTSTCAAALANVTTHIVLRRSACANVARTDLRGDEQ